METEAEQSCENFLAESSIHSISATFGYKSLSAFCIFCLGISGSWKFFFWCLLFSIYLNTKISMT
jgi:hypothetical protein